MFWLNPNTVPTMGNYFRAAGYQTYYKGKWHISNADIVSPGTHRSVPSYHPLTRIPESQLESLYLHASRLEDFGFSDRIGPDPIGRNPRNSASSAAFGLSRRDEVYAAETVHLIESLDRRNNGNKNVCILINLRYRGSGKTSYHSLNQFVDLWKLQLIHVLGSLKVSSTPKKDVLVMFIDV